MTKESPFKEKKESIIEREPKSLDEAQNKIRILRGAKDVLDKELLRHEGYYFKINENVFSADGKRYQYEGEGSKGDVRIAAGKGVRYIDPSFIIEEGDTVVRDDGILYTFLGFENKKVKLRLHGKEIVLKGKRANEEPGKDIVYIDISDFHKNLRFKKMLKK